MSPPAGAVRHVPCPGSSGRHHVASQMQVTDPYETLGVGRDASDAEIKKAFRRLARDVHPDVNRDDPEAERKFKELAGAYEILSDPERRATFDRYGHEGLRQGGFAPNFDAFGSFADIFEAFLGGRAAGAPVRARARTSRRRSTSASPTRRAARPSS